MTQKQRQRHPEPVPDVVTWTGEELPPATVVMTPNGVAYADERPRDRDVDDVLWARSGNDRTGEPQFADMHPARQRAAMENLTCQVCTKPAERTPEGVMWLLPDDRSQHTDWPDWPNGVATSNPPVCERCAPIAADRCRRLRRGCVAFRAREAELVGVEGWVYPPPGAAASRGHRVVLFDDPAIRWTIADQLIRELRSCTHLWRAVNGRRVPVRAAALP